MERKISLVLLAVLVFGMVFIGCSDGNPEPVVPLAPSGVFIINGVLTWGAVSGADGYNVYINATFYQTTAHTQLIIPQDLRSRTINVEAFSGNLRSPLSQAAIVINNSDSEGSGSGSDLPAPNFPRENVSNGFERTIPATIDKITFVGVRGVTYTNVSINIEPRYSELIIELENVYAIGRTGPDGTTSNYAGSNGRPVIQQTENNPNFLPELIILSQGTRNGLIGGNGGNGLRFNETGRHGRVGGNGAVAISGANSLKVIGNGRLIIGGGDGGNGGNGGSAIIANMFTVTMNAGGVKAYRPSLGGKGGFQNSGRLSNGVNGSPGANGNPKYINYAGNEIYLQGPGPITEEPR